MTKEHPITPPPQLVREWWDGTHGAFYEFEAVTTQAARWGADQELEACCEWLTTTAMTKPWETVAELALELCIARRPKPPSLKKQALEALAVLAAECYGNTDKPELIRRALETLSD